MYSNVFMESIHWLVQESIKNQNLCLKI